MRRLSQLDATAAIEHYQYRLLASGIAGLIIFPLLILSWTGMFLQINQYFRERRKAEDELRESAEKIRSVFEAVSDGIGIMDMQGNFVDMNDTMPQLYGFPSKTQLIGHHISMLIEDSNRSKVAQFMKDLALREHMIISEVKLKRQNNNVYDGEIGLAPLKDKTGAFIGYVSSIRDVTERKVAEEALRRSESMYRLIVNTAHEGIWQVDKELRTSYVNPTMASMLGYTQSEMLGKSIYDFIAEEHQQRARQLVHQRQTTGSIQAEVAYRRNDGSTLWGLGVSSNMYDEQNQQIGAIAFITDITERKKAQEALAENEIALAALINNVDDSIFSIDQDRHLLSFNSVCARRVKEWLNIDLFRGMALANYFPQSYIDEYFPLFDRVLTGESFAAPTHIAMPEQGIEVYNEVNCNPIYDPSGSITGAAIFVRDITQSKKAELALRASEERFRRVVENIPLSFYLYDVEQDRFIYANKIGEKTFANLTGQTIGKRGVWRSHIYPEDLEALKNEVDDRKPLTNGTAEYRVVYPWGEIRYMRQIAFPILEKDNEVLQIANFIEDITERKRTERALQQNEWLLSNVLLNLPTGVAVFSLDGNILTLNARYAYYFNQTVDYLIGRNVRTVLPQEHLGLWSQLTTITLKTNEIVQYESRMVVDDVTYTVLIECFPLFDTDNNVFASGEIIIDITDQKRIQEQLRDLSKQIIEVQEKERRHIAGELHDEVGQSLTGVLLLLNKVERNISEEGIGAVKQIQDITRQLMAQIRELSHSLHPPILDNHGLMSALHWYCNHYTSQTQIEVAFKYTGLMDRLSPEIELTCYRVIQEALTNIARYAKVQQASVEVYVSQSFVKLSIEDKGVGFDMAAAQAKNETFGLSGMRERVGLLHGKIDIVSALGQGTTIKVNIPLMEIAPFEQDGATIPDSQ